MGIVATTRTSNEIKHFHNQPSLCFTQHQLHLVHPVVPVVHATFAHGQVKESAVIGRAVRLSDRAG
jgi:hypothetical protein